MTRATLRPRILLACLVITSLASAGCSSLIGVPEVPDVPDAASDDGADAAGMPDSNRSPIDAGAQQ